MLTTPSLSDWRHDAARIVEELFAVTSPAEWDLLLDLRGELIRGAHWDRALDLFLACRSRLESDHYLPFYRLRRLLDFGLRLDGDGTSLPSLADLLREKHPSLDAMTRAVQREWFEFGGDCRDIPALQVVERAA